MGLACQPADDLILRESYSERGLGIGVWECSRHLGTQTKNRETDISQTDRQTDMPTNRDKQRQAGTKSDRQTDRHKVRQTDRRTGRQADWQTDRDRGGDIKRQMDRWTGS